MPPDHHTSLTLASPDATDRFAAILGARLGPGDCLLLQGGIGAGKTHFARALIRSLLPVPEDVPSPTFTLVQVYDGPGFEIWHSDLYRLTHPDEVAELGLTQAFDTALCLIEWPDRLGDMAPRDALHLAFGTLAGDDGARRLDLSWQDARWGTILEDLIA